MTEGILRVCFRKKGVIRYISHLDTMRMFLKAFARADIELKYSEGFNPHPRLSFALPLSVGMQSEYELAEFYTVPDENGAYPDEKAAQEALSRELSFCGMGINFCEYYSPDKGMKPFSEIESAEYKIVPEHPLSREDGEKAAKDLADFLGLDAINVEKRTKNGGTKTTDIKSMIFCAEIESGADGAYLRLVLSADPQKYLNPEYVISALTAKYPKFIDILGGGDIIRTRIDFRK